MSFQLRAFHTLPADMPHNPLHTVVRTPEQFQTMMNRIAAANHVSLDTETSGLKWYQHARMCGVGLAVWDERGHAHSFYTPFRHQTGEAQLPESAVLPAFKWVWERSDALKIGAHLKFEDHMGRREGWKLNGTRYDVQVAAHLYDENRDIGLKKRAKSDLGREDAEAWDSALDREVVRLAKLHKMGKKDYRDRYGYSQIHTDLAGFYGCNDVEFALGLHGFYERKQISTYYGRIWQTEMALTEVLCDVEEAGLPINVEYLENLRDSLAGIQAGLESQIQAMLGHEYFPPGNDDQLRDYLEKRLRLPLWKMTEKGDKYAVDYEVLSQFAKHYPQIAKIMEWREAEKLRNTYTTSILSRMDANNVLHGSLRQNGTETGRMSSSEPNLQNFPSDDDDRAKAFTGLSLKKGGIDPWSIRRAFITRGKGWSRLFFDYSQIELRVLAFYSRDPVMLDAYARGQDIHLRTQMEVFNDDDKDSPRRRIAKIINFGLSYCLTAKGLARQAGIPLHEAEEFMGTFERRYAGITNFRFQFWQMVRRNGGWFNNLWGRTRRVPSINAPEGWMRGRGERMAIGSLIQGTAAELTKESMVRIHRRFKAEGIPAFIVTVIHDDIQADVQNEVRERAGRIMKEEMERYPEFGDVPILVDGQYTETNWAEKHPLPL